MGKPLSVAVGAVVDNGKILMIKRQRGDYSGFWALPGGKIEQGEHISEAAIREVKEEAGIETNFKEYSGIVSEIFGQKQFMLHVNELKTIEKSISSGSEGEVKWIELDSLEGFDVVPSDLKIIEEVVLGNGGYFDCEMSEMDGEHVLEKFDRRGRGFQD